MSLEEWIEARPARRDLRLSLPIDYRNSDTDWSLLDSSPEIAILRLQMKSRTLSNTKEGSYVKTDTHMEVAPVHVRRFHDLRPLHAQPRLSFGSFRTLLSFMESMDDAYQLYYGTNAADPTGNIERNISMGESSRTSSVFAQPAVLNTVEAGPIARNLQGGQSAGTQDNLVDSAEAAARRQSDRQGSMSGPTGFGGKNPTESELRTTASSSYSTRSYAKVVSNGHSQISRSTYPSQEGGSNGHGRQGDNSSRSEFGDLDPIIKAVQDNLRTELGTTLIKSQDNSRPTRLDFEKHATTGITHLTKSVLDRVYKHYRIDTICISPTKMVLIVAVPLSLVPLVFGKNTKTVKSTNEQVLSHCKNIVAALLGEGNPTNRIYGFEYPSLQLLFVGSMVVCICSVQ
jgi:hypothetical protein